MVNSSLTPVQIKATVEQRIFRFDNSKNAIQVKYDLDQMKPKVLSQLEQEIFEVKPSLGRNLIDNWASQGEKERYLLSLTRIIDNKSLLFPHTADLLCPQNPGMEKVRNVA